MSEKFSTNNCQFSYRAYGLGILSDIEFPELIQGKGSQDLVIKQGVIGEKIPCLENETVAIRQTEQGLLLSADGVGVALVRDGSEIIIQPDPKVSKEVLRLFLLAFPLGVALRQRGYLVLHGSGVALEGKGVIFLGPKKWGKSTLAAAFFHRGYSVVCDDLAAVTFFPTPMLLSGFPQLKVWPDAADFLGDISEDLPRLRPELEKRSRSVLDRFSQDPIPLKYIFLLERGDSQHIEIMKKQDACIGLIRHSYALRQVAKTEKAKDNLFQCADLAEKVTICRLVSSRLIEELPKLVDLVEQYCACQS